MAELKRLAWFAYHSWSYLSCDGGSGRWAARRHYVHSFIPAYRTFRRLCLKDEAHG